MMHFLTQKHFPNQTHQAFLNKRHKCFAKFHQQYQQNLFFHFLSLNIMLENRFFLNLDLIFQNTTICV